MPFMKLIRTTLLAATLFTLVSGPAFAQTAGSKIATVDMKKLFNGYWKTKEAQALLEKSKADLQKDLKEMSENFLKSQTAYKQLLDQANDPVLSSDEREKRKTAAADKAKELNSAKAAFEQYQRQAESTLADKSTRMSSNLVGEIQKAVADQAKIGKYNVVLNSATAEVVVFSDTSTDITDLVLKQLKDGAPIDLNQQPTGLPLNISTNIP